MENKIEKTKVYNVIIMDRSGSMWEIRKPAIMGYNEVLGGVKAAAEKYGDTQEHYFTLVLFDGSAIDEVYWNAPVADAAILTDKTYVPGASTPLYDAMGRTLSRLEKELAGDTNHSVVVTVITDGYENASREYDLFSISEMVILRLHGHRSRRGWRKREPVHHQRRQVRKDGRGDREYLQARTPRPRALYEGNGPVQQVRALRLYGKPQGVQHHPRRELLQRRIGPPRCY